MTTTAPKVSIVTPVYNEETHLAECIESVQRQTHQNWEYAIVDNCSTDASAVVAQRYAEADPRITVLRPSEFVSSFRNCNRALTIFGSSRLEINFGEQVDRTIKRPSWAVKIHHHLGARDKPICYRGLQSRHDAATHNRAGSVRRRSRL